MDSLILRSNPVHRKILIKKQLAKQVKQLSLLLPEIDESKELTVKMATKDGITKKVKYHKTKKVFEPQYFWEKHGECEIMLSFNNYCKLNKIVGQEKC